jgi:hypothetical protein
MGEGWFFFLKIIYIHYKDVKKIIKEIKRVNNCTNHDVHNCFE